MFNSLSGIISAKLPQTVYLDTHGIEWELCVPDTALDALPAVGQQARIFTWLQHSEDSMKLYGFVTEADRRLFFDLVKVDGIGPRAAVKIMSNISCGQLVAALDGGDVARLEKVPGVGKKTAAKMLLALKGRLTLDMPAAPSAARTAAGTWHDLIESLCGMGYEKAACTSVVQGLAARMESEDAAFAARPYAEKEAELFRRALVELASAGGSR